MQLMKPFMREANSYILQVEPGERVEIRFSPDGVNAPKGSESGTTGALSVRGRTLPSGDLALTVDFNESALYKEVPPNTGPAWLVVWRDHSPNRAEFELDQERPWDKLVLEKVDLQALLRHVPEEPSDG